MSINVLQVGVSKNPGGVETLILNYYKKMNHEKIKFDLLDIYGEGVAFENQYINMGSRVYRLPNYKKNIFKFIKEYISLIRNKKFDIIHIHMQSAANILVVLLSLIAKKTIVICHSHSTSTPKGVLRKILNYVNKFILRKLYVQKWACGKNAGEWMWGSKFKDKNIIYNAINYDLYKFNEKKRIELREKFKIDNDTCVLGFVGRFGDEKNVFFLIDILYNLINKSKKYKLLTVGKGELKESFIEKLRSKNLLEYYIDLGVVEDTSSIYNMIDVFLLPSFFEGVPVVAVEAQSNGIISLVSSNISKEVSISSKLEFLDINDSFIWSERIKKISLNYDRNTDVESSYKLDYASFILENKYEKLMKNSRIRK